LMGELGVLALLFMIGLELSLEKLSELKRYIFGLGSAQIIITGIVIAIIALLFGNSLQTSIVIGVGFALSSTAIVMQSLKEYHLTRKTMGKMSFSILLMQDMAVVPILILIGAFSTVDSGAGQTPVIILFSLILSLILVAFIYFLGKKILQPTLHKVIGTKKDEWLASFSLFVLCLLSLIVYKLGLSPALGAFLAGLLIAETEFKEKIEAIIEPLKSILIGIFFISVGMMVNLTAVVNNLPLLGLSIVGIFVIKAATLYPICRSFGIKHQYARDISTILCQPGEFTLMVISVSMASGLLPYEDAQFFLLVCVLGMLASPLIFRIIPSVRTAKNSH